MLIQLHMLNKHPLLNNQLLADEKSSGQEVFNKEESTEVELGAKKRTTTWPMKKGSLRLTYSLDLRLQRLRC